MSSHLFPVSDVKTHEIPSFETIISRLTELCMLYPTKSGEKGDLYAEVRYNEATSCYWRGSPWKVLYLMHIKKNNLKNNYDIIYDDYIDQIEAEIPAEENGNVSDSGHEATDDDDERNIASDFKIFRKCGVKKIDNIVDQMIFDIFHLLRHNDTAWLVKIRGGNVELYE